MLEKEAALLKRAEGSQVIGSKRKEVTASDEEGQQPSKKARGKQPGKYCRGATVKMEGANLCKRCVSTRQNCLVHLSRWVIFFTYYYYYFINNFLLYSRSLAYTRCIALKQWCILHTNPNPLAMIPTYDGVLSAIEKALQELVEEYWGVRKSLQDLVKSQERNIAQLERIGAMMERRWSSEGEVRKKESRDDAGGSKDGPRKIQEEGTLLSTFC